MLQKRRVPGEKWRTEGTSDSHRTAWTDRLKEAALNTQNQHTGALHGTKKPHPKGTAGNYLPSQPPQHSQDTKKTPPNLTYLRKTERSHPQPTPGIAFQRPKNLRDMLVHAELSEVAPPTKPGNIPCNNRRSKTCNILIQSDSFTSPCTGHTQNTI